LKHQIKPVTKKPFKTRFILSFNLYLKSCFWATGRLVPTTDEDLHVTEAENHD